MNTSHVRRCVLVLLDGLGDRSFSTLGNKTPLQAACTPNLDRLAAVGSNGLFHALRPGRALPSENAHFAIFGYSPEEFPGRGLLEAMGYGIKVKPDDVAVLAHFAGLQEKDGVLFLEKDRPESTREEATQLSRAVAYFNESRISCNYIQTRGLDGIIVMNGPVSHRITDSHCFTEGSPLMEVQAWRTGDERAKVSARVLTSYLLWCRRILDVHPVNLARGKNGRTFVNGLVTQRAGQWKKVAPFSRRWGLRAVSISSGAVYWGLAQFIGMDVHEVKDTGNPGEDLCRRLRWVAAHKDDYSFFHVHTKTPDQAAHTKNPQNKVAVIESLDRGIGKMMDHFLNSETVLVVTADHSTPSGGPLIHSGEPVPIMVTGPGIRQDAVKKFDEVCCAGGALGQLQGDDFMYYVLNWLDLAKLQGLMDTPENQPYWPGRRKFLRVR